jgi:hypothetical protein
MNRNFILSDAVTIEFNEKWFDLHNCFDISKLLYSFTEKKLVLSFSGLPEFLGGTPTVTMEFSEILRISHSPGLLDLEEPTLIEMGFKNPDDYDHDWIIEENMATTDDDFFIRFVKDEYLRIHCKHLVASVTY